MSGAVLKLPGCAPRKVKQEGRTRSAKLADVPSLTEIREDRKVAAEQAAAMNVKAMEKALIRLLTDVGFGKVKGLAIIQARGSEADQVTLSGVFSEDYGYAQRCVDCVSDMLEDAKRVNQS